MKALAGIEAYVTGLLDEVYHDLTFVAEGAKKLQLQAKKEAYKEVLQYMKDGEGIL